MSTRDALRSFEVRGLVKTYPGVVALDGADVALHGGSIHGLLGKNGAGKSTLIKIMAGVVQPEAGELLLDGAATVLSDPRAAASHGLAFVHQELADVPNLSVAENIALGLGFPKRMRAFVNTRALRRRAADTLDQLEADIDPAMRLSRLSIVQRRLVMIARGLAAEASLFVLDEPTASLTDVEIEHLHGVLRSLRARGVAIAYVSHRLDEVLELTDALTVLRDGRTVFHGETAAVTKASLIDHITGSSLAPQHRKAPTTRADAPELLRVEGVRSASVAEPTSFSLRTGEILGIAGLVGAGRTELVRIIAGADPLMAGAVFVRGEPQHIRSPRDAIAAGIVLLPEERKTQGAVLDFSVRENMTLPTLNRFRAATLLPLPSRRLERTASREMVERLSIKVAHVEQPTRHLSGGNQQKVVLSKWLLSTADVFIFDEPTHGIDVAAKEEVYDLMGELAGAGKGLIFISSEFTELVGSCSRVLAMRDGRLVGEFVGEQITDEALVAACYGQVAGAIEAKRAG